MSLPPTLAPLAEADFHCPDCAFDYASTTVATCREILAALPERIGTIARALDDQALRHRPSQQVWSTLEYVCHLRDVYATYTIRLYRIRTEDRPALEPMLNDLRALRFHYNELSLPGVLEALAANLAGFLDEIGRVRDWQRTATRCPDEERDALWMVRQATHEGLHHLLDISPQ
jgi:hypothetical protein